MDFVDNINQFFERHKLQILCSDYKDEEFSVFYDLTFPGKTKVKTLLSFGQDLCLYLKQAGQPSFAQLPDSSILRMTFPKRNRPKKKVLNDSEYFGLDKFKMFLGHTYDGKPFFFDMKDAPHLLIAGTTGSGKSNLLHVIIANALRDDIIIFIIDPKQKEFAKYKSIPEIRIQCTLKEAISTVSELNLEMERRYAGTSVNETPILFIIDEISDLFGQDHDGALKKGICRLAQKSRAVDIHIILATQRPSATIISGDIKANFPARICCRTASAIDSRVTLDATGAEHLMGNGDAIISDSSHSMVRFQVAFADPSETAEMFGE